MVVRSGMGLITTGRVSFVYANPEGDRTRKDSALLAHPRFTSPEDDTGPFRGCGEDQ